MNDFPKGVTRGRGKKFDLQFSQALVNERRLAEIFAYRTIEKVELKSEKWLWEKTWNLCVEFEHDGRPSGIAATQADYWVHELKRGGETLVYLMFPIDRLKALCRDAYQSGAVVRNCGDDGLSSIVKVRLGSILK